jgi:hypothetical protein
MDDVSDRVEDVVFSREKRWGRDGLCCVLCDVCNGRFVIDVAGD